MLNSFKLADGMLRPVASPEKALWVHLEKPTEEEMEQLQQLAKIPFHIMRDVQDDDEMPHIDYYGDKRVIFLDVPVKLKAEPEYQTWPLCLIMESGRLFTITAVDFPLPSLIKSDQLERMEDANDLFIGILLAIMTSYISTVKQMEGDSNWKSSDYHNPPHQNTLFFELLDLQKSLIDFETSLQANHVTLEAVQSQWDKELEPHQKLWVNNILVESNQVVKMYGVYGQVLEATAGISESIVSNNLNDVMKTLTSLTILFSAPTIITAIFTMNTRLPESVNNILFPILLSMVAGVLVLVFLKRRKML